MQTTETKCTAAAAHLRSAKTAFTRAAMAALAGAPDAVQLTTRALADLEQAFAALRAIERADTEAAE